MDDPVNQNAFYAVVRASRPIQSGGEDRVESFDFFMMLCAEARSQLAVPFEAAWKREVSSSASLKWIGCEPDRRVARDLQGGRRDFDGYEIEMACAAGLSFKEARDALRTSLRSMGFPPKSSCVLFAEACESMPAKQAAKAESDKKAFLDSLDDGGKIDRRALARSMSLLPAPTRVEHEGWFKRRFVPAQSAEVDDALKMFQGRLLAQDLPAAPSKRRAPL